MALENVARAYPLVPFEGVPQLTEDGLIGLASSRLRKEDNEVRVVRGGLAPPLPRITEAEALEA